MTTYFGFAIADSMFPDECNIRKTSLSVAEVRDQLANEGVEFVLNPSHWPTIEAARSRFDLAIAVPAKPPQVLLGDGDSIIVMGVRGLPRLTDRHEYTAGEIAGAAFSFSLYTVVHVRCSVQSVLRGNR